MTDLTKRLRSLEVTICHEAAGEIERLEEAVTEQPEKWTFDTMMWAADRLLAEKYPAKIFTGVSGDAGPRLVAALRDCREATNG